MTGDQDQRMEMQARPSSVAQPLKRILWTGAGWTGLLYVFGWSAGIPAAAAASPKYRPSNAVPAAWARYARQVQDRFQAWLAADDPVAYRFHVFLEDRVVSGDTPPGALIVKVWIAKDGKVQRVDFTPLADKQATGDLRAILTQGNIGEPPPHDLLQPVHLRLALKMTN